MRRLPIVTLCTAVVVWLVSERLVHASPALISAMSVIGAAALAYHLATCVKRQVRDGSAGLIFRHHEPITGS
jgi:hypothetical protein